MLNSIDNLTTSSHYFYKKCMETQKENLLLERVKVADIMQFTLSETHDGKGRSPLNHQIEVKCNMQ